MNKRLYLCSSPYTVFNAMNIEFTKNSGTADIILFHKTESMQRISKNIDKINLFNFVYNVKDFQKSEHINIISLLFIMNPELMLNKFNLNEEKIILRDYDIVLSQNYFFIILLSRALRDPEYYLIEDGTGSYIYNLADKKARNKYLLRIDKYLFKEELIPEIDGQILYKEDWQDDFNGKKYRLPLPQSNNINQYDMVFDYQNNELYSLNTTIIFGDGNMDDVYVEGKNKYEILSEVLLSIKSLDKDNIAYRKHPAESINRYNSAFKMDDFNNLWELECLKQISSNHTLISFFSTAVTTPKILYDKEPSIILLYKYLNLEKKIEVKYDNLAEKLISMYSDKSKIHILTPG